MKGVQMIGFDKGKKELLASVSGRLVQNMEVAAKFAADDARRRVASHRRSGRLEANIVDVVSVVTARGQTVTGWVGVKRKAYWGWFLEMGTRRQRAWPFLRPAVFNNAREIVRILMRGS